MKLFTKHPNCYQFCTIDSNQLPADTKTIAVQFDISDFNTEQAIYDYFANIIYGKGREHLNTIWPGTTKFGRGLNPFNDYLTDYLILIQRKPLNERLVITVTNHKSIKIDGFWTTFIDILICDFFSGYKHSNISYEDSMVLNIENSILEEVFDMFAWLTTEKLDADERLESAYAKQYADKYGNYHEFKAPTHIESSITPANYYQFFTNDSRQPDLQSIV